MNCRGPLRSTRHGSNSCHDLVGSDPATPAFRLLWFLSCCFMWTLMMLPLFFSFLRASLVAQLVKNWPEMWETWVWSLGWEDPLEKGTTTHSKLIPGLGRSSGEENHYPLQYSDLENSMDWIVHGVAKSWTQLTNFHFTSYIYMDNKMWYVYILYIYIKDAVWVYI